MGTILLTAADIAAHLQGLGIVVILLGIVGGALRVHWLAGGRRA